MCHCNNLLERRSYHFLVDRLRLLKTPFVPQYWFKLVDIKKATWHISKTYQKHTKQFLTIFNEKESSVGR